MILRQPTLEQIQDVAVRESLQWFLDYLSQATLLQGEWSYFERTFLRAETIDLPHGLPFIPKDIIVTAVVGTADVTFQHDNFSRSTLRLTASAACVVRFFAGRHKA